MVALKQTSLNSCSDLIRKAVGVFKPEKLVTTLFVNQSSKSSLVLPLLQRIEDFKYLDYQSTMLSDQFCQGAVSAAELIRNNEDSLQKENTHRGW